MIRISSKYSILKGKILKTIRMKVTLYENAKEGGTSTRLLLGSCKQGNVMFHMQESGEVILTFILVAGGELSFEAIGAISSFMQTHYTTSIRQEIKLGKAGSYSLPWVSVVMEYCTGRICIHRLLL